MKQYFTALFSILSITAFAQQDSMLAKHTVYERHSVQAAVSLGFIDAYRPELTVPAGFEKNNTSGYANFSVKLDYALTDRISLAANFGYDAFVYNLNQLDTGNNGVIRRYKVDRFKMFNAGLIAYYHLGSFINIKNLDPFVGIGLSLNNLRYSASPQGDSTVIRTDHTVTPYLKIGVRYYISNRFSLFADLGYEKQSMLSIGASCRFFSKTGSPK